MVNVTLYHYCGPQCYILLHIFEFSHLTDRYCNKRQKWYNNIRDITKQFWLSLQFCYNEVRVYVNKILAGPLCT